MLQISTILLPKTLPGYPPLKQSIQKIYVTNPQPPRALPLAPYSSFRFFNSLTCHFLTWSSVMTLVPGVLIHLGMNLTKLAHALSFSLNLKKHFIMCLNNLWSSLPFSCISSMISFRIWATANNLSPVWHTYSSPLLSSRIFWTIKVATVLDSSLPLFIILRHNTMSSVFI